MAMFGSENPSSMGGGGPMLGGGSMDPMLLEAMMRNLPELKARQRRAEQLRGVQDQFGAMGAEGPNNYTRPQSGGLYPTVAKYHTDYGQIGKAAAGALGGYMAGQGAESAQAGADQLMSREALGAAQAIGGGNTGGRMGDPNNGMGAGLQSPPPQMAPPGLAGGMIQGGPGVGGGGVTPPSMNPPGGGGANPNPAGQMRQNAGMSMRGNAALANLARWFGQ